MRCISYKKHAYFLSTDFFPTQSGSCILSKNDFSHNYFSNTTCVRADKERCWQSERWVGVVATLNPPNGVRLTCASSKPGEGMNRKIVVLTKKRSNKGCEKKHWNSNKSGGVRIQLKIVYFASLIKLKKLIITLIGVECTTCRLIVHRNIGLECADMSADSAPTYWLRMRRHVGS